MILASVPFILQLVACVFCFLARDGAAGAALGVLAATWFAMSAVHIASPSGSVSGALGLLLLASAGSLGLSALVVATVKPLPALLFLAAAVRFALAGVYQLGGASEWAHASGILGLVVSGIAGYCALAFELESQGRRVLPTCRRSVAAQAADRHVDVRVDRLRREPGVRPTT